MAAAEIDPMTGLEGDDPITAAIRKASAGASGAPPPGLSGGSASPQVDPMKVDTQGPMDTGNGGSRGAGQPSTPEAIGPATPSFSTRLLEGDPNKMNAEHAAKSPKYDFLNAANSGKYNYDQMDQ